MNNFKKIGLSHLLFLEQNKLFRPTFKLHVKIRKHVMFEDF